MLRSFYLPLVALFTLFSACTKTNFQTAPVATSSTLTSSATDQINQMFCSFDGKKYITGNSIMAYQNSSVAVGSKCISEVRICQANGTFSGSFAYSSCSAGVPSSCLFNGVSIAHGGSVTAYPSSSVASGSSCAPETRTCSNGVLSGSAAYATCSVNAPVACLFNGQTISSGLSVAAFQTSTVAYGKSCVSESRKCTNGTLSGSYTFASCSAGAAAACNFNEQTISDSQVVKAFQASSVAYGQTCVSQDRICMNGTLTGTYTNSSCSVQSAASCTFNGATVANGASVTAYTASAVTSPASCSSISQTRTCSNGTLSGSASYGSCSVTAEKPTCTSTEVIAATKSYIETIIVPESEVISNCIDTFNTTYQSNDPALNDWNFIRFFNTCGNRYCTSRPGKNYVEGRVTERSYGLATVECRRKDPPATVSTACQQKLLSLPAPIVVKTVAETTVGNACIDSANLTLDENSMHMDNPHSIRFIYTCGNRWCRKQGYSNGRVVENNAGSLTVNCYQEEIFNQLDAGTIVTYNAATINDVSTSCMDAFALKPSDSYPSISSPNQMRFINTCGNRYCKAKGLGASGGWIVEVLANSSGVEGNTVTTVMCMK